MIYNKNKIRILISFLAIFTLSNCSTLITLTQRMAFGPSVELEFIEKTPFEIPPLQKIQPMKDFSFQYKVGEFNEEVESIRYTDIQDKSELILKELFTKKANREIKYISGRTFGKQKTTYTKKVLNVKANGDYLLSTSWIEKEKFDCEIPNLRESWYDKNSNFIEHKKAIYNCKEYKNKPKNDFKDPNIKYDNLTLGIPVFSESKNEKYTAKLEIQFIGISNYKNREVALITQNAEIETKLCIPDYIFPGNHNECILKINELIYIDLKSKVPLLIKIGFVYTRVTREDKTFSMNDLLDPLGLIDDFFPKTILTQEIYTYIYPSGYLE